MISPCRRTIRTAEDQHHAARDIMGASFELLEAESGLAAAGIAAQRRNRALEEENRELRERLRCLENNNLELQSRLAESRLAAVVQGKTDLTASAGADVASQDVGAKSDADLEAELAEAHSVIQALCSHVANIQARSDEKLVELKEELGRALQENERLETFYRTEQLHPSIENNELVVPVVKADTQYHDSAISMADEGDEEWALFASKNTSVDLERSFRSDERSIVRSRADKELREKERRIEELERAIVRMKDTSKSRYPGHEEEQVVAVSRTSKNRIGNADVVKASLPGKHNVSLPPVPLPGDGPEHHTTRAQMA